MLFSQWALITQSPTIHLLRWRSFKHTNYRIMTNALLLVVKPPHPVRLLLKSPPFPLCWSNTYTHRAANNTRYSQKCVRDQLIIHLKGVGGPRVLWIRGKYWQIFNWLWSPDGRISFLFCCLFRPWKVFLWVSSSMAPVITPKPSLCVRTEPLWFFERKGTSPRCEKEFHYIVPSLPDCCSFQFAMQLTCHFAFNKYSMTNRWGYCWKNRSS